MAITKITAKGSRKIDPAKKDAPGNVINFQFEKWVHPGMVKGLPEGKAEDGKIERTYGTFADAVKEYNGQVEFQTKEGKVATESLLSDLYEGRNARKSREASALAVDTPEAATAKLNDEIRKIAKKFGKSEESIRASLK